MINKLYKRLTSEAKSQKARSSLKAIHETCEEQFQSGILDFSIARIANSGAHRGVPQAQSIRNKSGRLYKELIDGWNVQHGKSNVSSANKSKEWVNRIEDPATRFLVNDLLAQKRTLMSELQILKSVKVLEIDMRVDQSGKIISRDQVNLVNTELEALQLSIEPRTFDKLGWVRQERGAVSNKNGEKIFEIGFISAIEKILGRE